MQTKLGIETSQHDAFSLRKIVFDAWHSGLPYGGQTTDKTQLRKSVMNGVHCVLTCSLDMRGRLVLITVLTADEAVNSQCRFTNGKRSSGRGRMIPKRNRGRQLARRRCHDKQHWDEESEDW